MRSALLRMLAAALVGCAARTPPAPAPTAEELHQACAARMDSARMRGAVHWHIYEYCIKEHS